MVYISNEMCVLSFSGPDDDVFVYLVDHGGPGYVAFIDGPVSLKL